MSADYLGGVSWRAPVLVRIGNGASEEIEGPLAAIHYLRHQWPHDRGPSHKTALELCSVAVDGGIPTDVAKEAFILAAIEVRLLASSHR